MGRSKLVIIGAVLALRDLDVAVRALGSHSTR